MTWEQNLAWATGTRNAFYLRLAGRSCEIAERRPAGGGRSPGTDLTVERSSLAREPVGSRRDKALRGARLGHIIPTQ